MVEVVYDISWKTLGSRSLRSDRCLRSRRRPAVRRLRPKRKYLASRKRSCHAITHRRISAAGIQNDYVDEPDLDKVRVGGLRGLANGLDPYSSYLTPEQVAAYKAGADSKKVGIGAGFSQVAGYLYVINVVKGGPADQAGVKSGDFIEYIDTKASRDISLYDGKQLVAGEKGTVVSLRVLRTAEKPQTIKVTRNAYTIPKAESRMEANKVGVVAWSL